MKPILFNTDMVRALLAGRKTVTRRVVKPQPGKDAHSPYECTGGRFAFRIGERACTNQYKPPYRPGDILYVRETWATWSRTYGTIPRILYKADRYTDADKIKWRPSIHMPREAARIFLRVKAVSVERLQDIDDGGVVAEGLEIGAPFDELWDSTIKKTDRALYGWDANPWVWIIEFERVSKEEAIK